jgi:hypothetical protein
MRQKLVGFDAERTSCTEAFMHDPFTSRHSEGNQRFWRIDCGPGGVEVSDLKQKTGVAVSIQ